MSFEKRPPKFLSIIAVYTLVLIGACSDRNTDEPQGDIRSQEEAYPYRQSGPYAQILKRCVLATTVEDSCSIQELPFIGNGIETPTINQVMDRVLVTHDWMGKRFENALMDAPDDTLLTLFSSVTSVFIGSEVRPSQYGSATAGIQLDPNHLWISSEEKSTVSTQIDEREEFGKDLRFLFIARVADEQGDRLTPFFSLTQDAQRTTEQMQPGLYRLLYHELTHAADFMPRHKIAAMDSSLKVFEAISQIRSDWLSNSLIADHPHSNESLKQLAQVVYAGTEATQAELELSAADIGLQMSEGGAVQFYSYYTQQEDLAQLVEASLMAYHYDARINVAFTEKPLSDSLPCDAYLVAWGERNRLAAPLVDTRARTALNLVLDEAVEVESYLDSELGLSEAMEPGVDWCNNHTPNSLAYTESLLRRAKVNQSTSPQSGPMFQEMIEFDRALHNNAFP